MQVLTLICLVALAFPQRDSLSGIADDVIIFDDNEDRESTSTTPSTTTQGSTINTTNCPCASTTEYNPVCGTDNVTYWNMGAFNCAKNCNPSTNSTLLLFFFIIILNLNLFDIHYKFSLLFSSILITK